MKICFLFVLLFKNHKLLTNAKENIILDSIFLQLKRVLRSPVCAHINSTIQKQIKIGRPNLVFGNRIILGCYLKYFSEI